MAVRAEGCHLIDAQGRRILDFHGNNVHQVGYGHPRVVAAIKAQLDTLPFCPRRYTNQAAIDLAHRLARLAPSGSAAIGMALKLARYATGRHKTLSMWDSFHGANLDAASVGGEALFRRDVGPLLSGTEHVPPPGLATRFFGDDGRAHERLADYIDYVLEVQGDVGAVIAEPMRWATVEPPPSGFWPRVRASCDRHGALLVFDEVPSCLSRTGTMFVTEQTGAVPDILVLGKGLGGGIMPMAAIVACGELDLVPEGALGHYTHEKGPVGCAAALATLDVIEEDGLLGAARDLGRHALERLGTMASRNCWITEVRGLGLHLGMEIGRRGEPDSDAAAERLLYRCLEAGLSFKLGGGNVVTSSPPLTIGRPELDRALDILEGAVAGLR